MTSLTKPWLSGVKGRVSLNEEPCSDPEGFCLELLLMDKILHDPKDPKLWELWYIPCNG